MAESTDRGLVERFATIVAQHLNDQCAVAMLLPWSSGHPPEGVLCPGGDDGVLDQQAIAQAIRLQTTIVVPCTFSSREEEAAASRILPQFSEFENVCIFMAHLIPPDLRLDAAMTEAIMRRHDAMLTTGADDILMDPDMEPGALRRSINLARTSWDLNVRRMQFMLDSEPGPVSPQELEQLQAHHRRLLWESIPRALMPYLKGMDRHLVETTSTVDKYRLIRRFDTVAGVVLHAINDDQNLQCAIKVIDKSTVYTPGELEGIYREYRFLSEIIRHPNVVRYLTMLHSPSRVYMVLEFAGAHNLTQVLSGAPGQRLDEEDTLDCFGQISKALAYCHSKDVAHRSVSVEHVVVNKLAGNDVLHCQLCDFRSAMVSRGATLSKTVCGSLPCIAPEVALSTPYQPRLADCWSIGVVLLETGGGLSSLSRSVQWYPQVVAAQQVAGRIREFFSIQGGCAQALAFNGGVQSTKIVRFLQLLLKPNPDERALLSTILEQLETIG